MTHDQLARRVAAREGVTVRDARRIIDAHAAEVAAALTRGEHAAIRGVGTLRPPRSPGGRTTFRASATLEAAPADQGCGPDRNR